MLQIIRVRGADALPYVGEMGRLRIEVFREFPYLYDGAMAYEEKYLSSYFACPDSVVVLAIDGDQVVGASTGLPLVHAEESWQKAFAGTSYPLEKIFYFGESVLLKSYRGKGIGHLFFDHREDFAASLAGISYTSFCAVLREEDHPRKPKDYRPNDLFWHKRGYEMIPEVRTTFLWKDLDEEVESAKPMAFWIRSLTA